MRWTEAWLDTFYKLFISFEMVLSCALEIISLFLLNMYYRLTVFTFVGQTGNNNQKITKANSIKYWSSSFWQFDN
jgi:hypothetical protein